MKPTYQDFLQQLKAFIPESRLITDPLRTLAYGTDASFYRLIPQIVVRVETKQEVIDLIRMAGSQRLPLTFRAGGTNLSGQAITDSVRSSSATAGAGDPRQRGIAGTHRAQVPAQEHHRQCAQHADRFRRPGGYPAAPDDRFRRHPGAHGRDLLPDPGRTPAAVVRCFAWPMPPTASSAASACSS